VLGIVSEKKRPSPFHIAITFDEDAGARLPLSSFNPVDYTCCSLARHVSHEVMAIKIVGVHR
jgi:hypothetical protein